MFEQILAILTAIEPILVAITTLAAIVAPIAVAKINSRSAFELEAAKLSFSAKTEAYKKFLTLAAKVTTLPDKEDVPALFEASMQASLFSNDDTKAALSDYSSLLMRGTEGIESTCFDYDLSQAYKRAVIAMQKELNIKRSRRIVRRLLKR